MVCEKPYICQVPYRILLCTQRLSVPSFRSPVLAFTLFFYTLFLILPLCSLLRGLTHSGTVPCSKITFMLSSQRLRISAVTECIFICDTSSSWSSHLQRTPMGILTMSASTLPSFLKKQLQDAEGWKDIGLRKQKKNPHLFLKYISIIISSIITGKKKKSCKTF